MPVSPAILRRRPLRLTAPPGPVPAAAAPVTTLPSAIVGLRVELLLGGLGWTDISTYVLQNRSGPGVTITRGHADESTVTQPSALSMYLQNPDGRFSDRNPTGPYYGYLGRNTQVRVSVPEGASYLRIESDQQSYAAAPDAPVLGITGDLELQVDVTLDNWNSQQALAGKWVTGGSQRSWLLLINEDGTLTFEWSTAGTGISVVTAQSTQPVPLPPLGRQAIKVTLAAASGTVTFWTAPAAANQAPSGPITSGWVQLGSAVVSGATSVFDSTAPVTAGHVPALTNGIYGKVHSLILLNGIGGTQAASPNFTTAAAGVSSFSDAQGNVWAVNGTAEISSRRYRFHGEVAAWPQAWDPTGTDVYVMVAAGGLLRRLGQRTKALNSPLYRFWVITAAGLIAYWPAEDAAGSQQIASAIPGVTAMVIGAGSPSLAADSSFACSAALPTVNSSTWTGTVPASTAAAWQVRFLMKPSQADLTAEANFLRIDTTGTETSGPGSAAYFYINGSGGPLQFQEFDSGGAGFSNTVGGSDYAGLHLCVSLTGTVSGGTVTIQADVLTIETGNVDTANITYTGTLGVIKSVTVSPQTTPAAATSGPATTSVIGHVAVVAGTAASMTALSSMLNPLNAWATEAAGDRFSRLCSEEGIAFRGQGNLDTSVPMGYQSIETLTALLQECADADRGVLFEPRQQTALGYRTSSSLTSQAAAVALSYPSAHLAGSLQPTEDDQQTANDVTVTRTFGSSARAVLESGPLSVQDPSDGVGTYDTAVPVNLAADAQAAVLAGWLLHMGTVNEPRYPQVSADLARSESAGFYYDVQDLDLGDRLTVSGTPVWLPPDGISQLAQELTENIGGYIYTISVTCVPEVPWETAAAGTAHADTDGAALASAAGAGDTTILVATAAGNALWTTSAGDFPFDIAVAGERITVTNITGAASPQSFTVTRSVNGVAKAHLAGEDVALFSPPIAALT